MKSKNIKSTLLHYLVIPNTYSYRWPSLLSQMTYCWPCQTTKVHYWVCEAIDKDVSSARLLQMTVLICPVDWVSFCHLLNTQHCCLCPNGGYNPPPTTHPPTPLSSYSPTPYNMPSVTLQSLCKKFLKIQQC